MDDEGLPLSDLEFSKAICGLVSRVSPSHQSLEWGIWKQYVRELNIREDPDRSWIWLENIPERVRWEYLAMAALLFG